MSNRWKVYIQVLKALKPICLLKKQSYVCTLAMLITGIVLGRTAQLSKVASELANKCKDASTERRFRRWIQNENIDPDLVYVPFAREIIEFVSTTEKYLHLAIDGSQVGRGCMVIMVCVIYRNRALPICWLVYEGKKGHTTSANHKKVLEKALPLLENIQNVMFLGDGEYDNVALLEWIDEQTDWKYVVRTSPHLLYFAANGAKHRIEDLVNHPGVAVLAAQVAFTAQKFGAVNLLCWWRISCDAPIFLVSNLAYPTQMRFHYKQRAKIETFFSDQKSRGFHLQKSHISDPSRLSRLLLAACLAYIWVICSAIFVEKTQLASIIDRPNRRDKSLFRLGLDWLKHQYKHEKKMPVSFQIHSFTLRLESVR